MENPNNSLGGNKTTPQNNTEGKKEGVIIRSIRTFEDDVSNLVRNQKVSTAQIVLAEQKKRQQQGFQEQDTDSEKPKGKIIKIIISIILFGLGAAALFFVIQMNLIPQPIKNIVPGFSKETPEIIKKEKTIEILTSSKTNQEVRNEISNKINNFSNENLDQIIEFEILKPMQTPEGESTLGKITANNLLNIINSNTSERFERSISDEFIFAVYTDSKPTPFIILKTNDINLSFSEVFSWESRMYNDLFTILDLKPEVPDLIRREVSIATSTTENAENSTTTKTVIEVFENPEPQFNPENFVDIVISNKDSRAIVDEAGRIILIYSFIDDENILITSNINVFQQVAKRLSAQKLLR